MMNRLLFFIFFSFLASSAFAQMPGTALTLKECYTLALERSESIAIQKEYIKETEGLALQSLSTALPKVAFAYSQKWQDLEGGHRPGAYTPEAKFTFSQPLFTGFKEFAAIAASRHVGRQRQAELKRARQLLFTDVSDAFYLYLSYQQDLDVLQNIHTVLLDRVAELEKREGIGRSRPAETASARSKLMKTAATLETLRGQKEVAAQLMEYLIGRPFERLVEEDIPQEDLDFASLYLKADDRADVVAARESFAAYKNNITAARSAFLPAVTLAANAYTKRSDLYDGNDWDATLSVNVPLFNGLQDRGQIAQARSQANQADLRLSQARRKALLDIRNAAVQLEASTRRVKALELAVDAAQKNYELQAEDFKKSLVNNLDVLQAIEDVQNARRDLVAAKAAASRAYWSLKVATGGI